MKNILIILSITVLTVSCTVINSNYNKPFINAQETTKLYFGMSQEDTIQLLGSPLYVESGGDGKVVWVYEVRTILAMSDLTTQQPNKTHETKKHDGPIHEMKLTFENGGLTNWGQK